jgi:polyferredoxin
MDACDDVMARLNQPLGLIRYGNQAMTEGKTEAQIPWFMRSRAWVYLGLLLACVTGLAFTVSHRALIELTLIRATDYPYQEIPAPQGQTQILNHFKVDLRNQTFEKQEVRISINSEFKSQGINLVISNHKASLAPGERERADLFVQFPKTLLTGGRGKISLQLETSSGELPRTALLMQEVKLVGPLR